MTVHLVQRLLRAEDLVRRRRADEYRRHVASQRSAKIDPNPHQIEAVMFALARIPDGGCILADEVGLGKTIEAGLVIAQLLAEGARRVIIVTPKALLGQWKQQLWDLFSIETKEVSRDKPGFDGDGVFLATRDLVGSDAGSNRLRASDRFDLCVVDEAHEVFAGIYKRFDRHGALKDESSQATMAARLSAAIRGSGTPILLLTATPIQNSLLELWGLVYYVDPTGTLLGDLSTFRQLFCPTDDRVLADGQQHELQRRLATILNRTLRRQAQDFMSLPFTGRQARLFDYTMSLEERALYEDVTSYILQPSLFAFRGNQRQLLLVAFHRLMASSVPALRKGLERVAARLRKMIGGENPEADVAMLGDLEEAEDPDELETAEPEDTEVRDIHAELELVESFIKRARANPTDSKAHAMLRAVALVKEQEEKGKSSGKVVIFTESLTTQDYLRTLLLESGAAKDSEVTLFRGTNNSPRALQALERWQERVGQHQSPETRPSVDVAMRLALVEEFRLDSRILISTEAGAKGLNLQFCDMVINYDLPWNPQRIEQRIGRCHRYGQQRDVTVINFLAADNETQRLTYEILSRKLDLFGIVLGASDEVLHRPSTSSESLAGTVGGDFEAQLRRIYERARTVGEVEVELRELRDAIAAKREEFESAQQRTADIIQRRFDAQVKLAFTRIQDELPGELAEFDRDVESVVVDYLDVNQLVYRITPAVDASVLSVEGSAALPESLREGVECFVGGAVRDSPLMPLHLSHPLVVAAIADVRARASGMASKMLITAEIPELEDLRGRRGRLRIVRVSYRGFESVDRIVPVAVLEGDDGPLPTETARSLLTQSISEGLFAPSSVEAAALDDALDELLFTELGDVGQHEQPRFEQKIEQIERSLSDRVLLLNRQRLASAARVARSMVARDEAIGFELRQQAEKSLRAAQVDVERLDAEIGRLQAGDDDNYMKWREHTQNRRYAKPELEQVFEAEFEVA